MGHSIKIASSPQEREAIYRFRYKVYMEELNKYHITADHNNKMLFDEADDYTVLYYACNDDSVIATVRSQRGTEGSFKKEDIEFFGIVDFNTHIHYREIAIVDRLIVDKDFRRKPLAHEMMMATYLGGLAVGTRVCFITCDEKLLHMYLRYGFRMYATPSIIASGEKRYKLILLLCDKNHLQKVKSPFFNHLPESLDDKGKYAGIVEENVGFKLTDDIQADYSLITKNTG